MRLLVIGAGATGGFYGARLAQAGRDVSFLVRPRRAERLAARGLTLRTPDGESRLAPRTVTASGLADEARFDAVLLAVKAPAIEPAIEDAAPAVGPDTLVLPVLNGMRHLDLLDARFGRARVLGGVARIHAALEDDGDAIVQRTRFDDLVLGARDPAARGRAASLAAAFADGGFKVSASDDIVADMWGKWVMLASLGASNALFGGSVGDIASAGGSALAARVLDEAASIAAATGNTVRPQILAGARRLLIEEGAPTTSSMYRDMQAGLPTENEHIIGDLLARAAAHGLDTPLLAAACTRLRVHERAVAGMS